MGRARNRRFVRSLIGSAAVVQFPWQAHERLINDSPIAYIHSLGPKLHVWTLNGRQAMEKALDIGVDRIVTDEPMLLETVLIDRHQWSGADDSAVELSGRRRRPAMASVTIRSMGRLSPESMSAATRVSAIVPKSDRRRS